MEDLSLSKIVEKSLIAVENEAQLKDMIADVILETRHHMNQVEDYGTLEKLKDRGSLFLAEYERHHLAPNYPLTEVLQKISAIQNDEYLQSDRLSYFGGLIDAIRETIPSVTTDRLRYEAHRFFITYYLNMQRLEIRDEGILKARNEMLENIKQLPGIV